jgi:hypothetical protein
MTNKQTFYTTYAEAVNWLHNDFVLCNNIADVDESIWDNMRFNGYDEDDNPIDIYQWYITSASASDVEYLEKHFGLLFTYSDKLDCFILCVDHFGTSWNYVPCEVLTHGEELSPCVKSYEELTGLKN